MSRQGVYLLTQPVNGGRIRVRTSVVPLGHPTLPLYYRTLNAASVGTEYERHIIAPFEHIRIEATGGGGSVALRCGGVPVLVSATGARL